MTHDKPINVDGKAEKRAGKISLDEIKEEIRSVREKHTR
jgi:hypothetical protein